ncbi:hypothetical protein ACFSO7_00695 [Bacillus sp. CGMCC 1.16607]|uniref:hypothetical protein n=1 Tax=Bacillus sp. CGMCC 1.16607 TaxID=3351842 RepID=UPI00362A58DF
MFSIPTLIICFIFSSLPFIPLFRLVSPLNQMLIMGNNKGIERDVFSPFDKLKLEDFRDFKNFININFYNFDSHERDSIYNLCLKVRNGFFIHISTGFLYLFLLFLLIINIFSNFIFEDKFTIIEQILWMFSLLLPFSIFYLIPLLRLMKKMRLAIFLEFLIIKLLRFPDVIIKYVWRSSIGVSKFIILSIYMCFIIYLWTLIPQISHLRIEILYYFFCLCIYHYGINYVLGSLFNKLDKNAYPDISLEHSRKIQKNFNYLFMFMIYVIAYLIKIETSGIFISITLIFLLDTFISNQQQIIKEYKNDRIKKM